MGGLGLRIHRSVWCRADLDASRLVGAQVRGHVLTRLLPPR